jgi:hypothetical protein
MIQGKYNCAIDRHFSQYDNTAKISNVNEPFSQRSQQKKMKILTCLYIIGLLESLALIKIVFPINKTL